MDGSRLQPHDKNQLELKLAYVIDKAARQQRYRVELWMFVPKTLGLDEENYKAEDFFSDSTSFVRLKTPVISLNSLARAGDPQHMFGSIQSELDALLAGEASRGDAAVRALKLLGAVVRSSVRDEVEMLLARFARLGARGVAGSRPGQEEVARLLDGFCEDLVAVLRRVREVGERSEHAAVPASVSSTWSAVDEYLALVSEEAFTRLVVAVDKTCHPSGTDAGPVKGVRQRLCEAAIAERRHREGRGYASLLSGPTEGGETLPFRKRLLKRIVSEVLYLQVERRAPGQLARDMVGMFAAAASMFAAAMAGIWAQQRWQPVSSAFVAAMVVSYIAKDRIKEWGKRYLGGWLGRFEPTRIVVVRSGSAGRLMGKLRESFEVRRPEAVEPQIREFRHADHPSSVAEAGRPEVVLCYTKEVSLSSRSLAEVLPGVDGLNDILRLNFASYRHRMDDPRELVSWVDPDSGAVVETECSRVYHLNLLLRVTTGSGRQRRSVIERRRVVIDQERIRRVESVGTAGLIAADPLTGSPGDLFHD